MPQPTAPTHFARLRDALVLTYLIQLRGAPASISRHTCPNLHLYRRTCSGHATNLLRSLDKLAPVARHTCLDPRLCWCACPGYEAHLVRLRKIRRAVAMARGTFARVVHLYSVARQTRLQFAVRPSPVREHHFHFATRLPPVRGVFAPVAHNAFTPRLACSGYAKHSHRHVLADALAPVTQHTRLRSTTHSPGCKLAHLRCPVAPVARAPRHLPRPHVCLAKPTTAFTHKHCFSPRFALRFRPCVLSLGPGFWVSVLNSALCIQGFGFEFWFRVWFRILVSGFGSEFGFKFGFGFWVLGSAWQAPPRNFGSAVFAAHLPLPHVCSGYTTHCFCLAFASSCAAYPLRPMLASTSPAPFTRRVRLDSNSGRTRLLCRGVPARTVNLALSRTCVRLRGSQPRRFTRLRDTLASVARLCPVARRTRFDPRLPRPQLLRSRDAHVSTQTCVASVCSVVVTRSNRGLGFAAHSCSVTRFTASTGLSGYATNLPRPTPASTHLL